MTPTLLRGAVLSFSATPVDDAGPGIDYLDDAVVELRGTHVAAVRDFGSFQREGGCAAACEDLRGGLILPGLVDAHVHYPQLDVIASYGTDLLDWLERYAFPAELAFASRPHAETQARRFLDALFAQGTTTALAFTTVHEHATDALFAEADRRGARLIAGKVLMDRNAPAALRDRDDGAAACTRLIERWHGQGRLAYAVTPRFAISCSDGQLRAAGRLLRRFPGLYLHSHIAEQRREIAVTRALFPQARHCADVYDRYGLLTARTVLAHGIHLSDAELERLAQTGTGIAFCPTSNLFLGSGLLRLERLRAFGVRMGVGTDVGAGTCLSMLATLGAGHTVTQLTGERWHPLTALHAATRGNAELLGLGDRIGSIAPGYEADLTVLAPRPGTVLAKRFAAARTPTEAVFAAMVLAGEDAIARTYVGGRLVYARDRTR